MKYVNNTDSEAPTDTKVDETLFDKTGSIVIGKKEKSYAKKISTTKNNELSERYYLKSHENVPYDPWGMYAHRANYLETKFKAVSKSTFDYYMMYLKTRNAIYMTRSQRSFIND